jgi:hypothetical protein
MDVPDAGIHDQSDPVPQTVLDKGLVQLGYDTQGWQWSAIWPDRAVAQDENGGVSSLINGPVNASADRMINPFRPTTRIEGGIDGHPV